MRETGPNGGGGHHWERSGKGSHTGRLLGRQASRMLDGLCLVESRCAEGMAERMPVLRRTSRVGKARALGVGRFSAHSRCRSGQRSQCQPWTQVFVVAV